MPSRAPIWADGASTALSGGYDSRRARLDRGAGRKRGNSRVRTFFSENVPGDLRNDLRADEGGIQHGLQGLHLLTLLAGLPLLCSPSKN